MTKQQVIIDVSKIEFIECKTKGYKARTEQNIRESDCTLAIAADFSTGGELCTHNLCLKHNKQILKIEFQDLLDFTDLNCEKICDFIIKNGSKLNIAGNGIYTFKKFGLNQKEIDIVINSVLSEVFNNQLPQNIVDNLVVNSGGQTGMDEAGIKAATANGVPTKIIAPKGWMFRIEEGTDNYSEYLFKKRFE